VKAYPAVIAYCHLMTLKVFSVLPVTVNLACEGVSGMIPGGNPSVVFLSGLNRVIAGGYCDDIVFIRH
jgi:hypothetical protein